MRCHDCPFSGTNISDTNTVSGSLLSKRIQLTNLECFPIFCAVGTLYFDKRIQIQQYFAIMLFVWMLPLKISYSSWWGCLLGSSISEFTKPLPRSPNTLSGANWACLSQNLNPLIPSRSNLVYHGINKNGAIVHSWFVPFSSTLGAVGFYGDSVEGTRSIRTKHHHHFIRIQGRNGKNRPRRKSQAVNKSWKWKYSWHQNKTSKA